MKKESTKKSYTTVRFADYKLWSDFIVSVAVMNSYNGFEEPDTYSIRVCEDELSVTVDCTEKELLYTEIRLREICSEEEAWVEKVTKKNELR